MGENSAIEWTDHTFNPWVGCTKISPACDHCYAEAWSKRAGSPDLWAGERRRTTEQNWRNPLKWNAAHDAFYAEHGRRQRVFCASLADVFDSTVQPRWRTDLFRLIGQTPNLDWLLLTKRIGNAPRMMQEALHTISKLPMREGLDAFPLLYPNVWMGATVVNQAEADRDIPKLLRVPAAIRFLSIEPMLEPLDIRRYLHGREDHGVDLARRFGSKVGACIDYQPPVDWVIVGGESGGGARPFVLGHAKQIVRHCELSSVPVFVKQVGSNPVNREGEPCPHIKDRKGRTMSEWPLELRVQEFPVAR